MVKLTFNEDTHRYFTDEGVEVPSVTTILNFLTADHYGSISPAILDRARAKGTAVHECTQLIDYGCDIEEISPEIVPYVRAYQTFLRDYRPNWEGIEQVVSFGTDYCGTVDRYGTIGKRKVVVDIKTTSSPNKLNYMALCCQTNAYGRAISPLTDFDRYGLYLKSNGDYRFFSCKSFEEKQEFDSAELFTDCLALYQRIKRVEAHK